jgi:Histidine kinase-, DNA gyrase B-, and HSP90-like ATPase
VTEKIEADASPEKRLFVSLITRDIPLIAAFLDLIDNSINAAVEPYSERLLNAEGYEKVYKEHSSIIKIKIELTVNTKFVSIKDSACGIQFDTARNHVFKFGRTSEESHKTDRLSVYGIGLKRAIFKIGNKISIKSDHTKGGFELELNVSKWEKDKRTPWIFDITTRNTVKTENTGTEIQIKELFDETKRRIDDGTFVGQLREAISRTYAFYLASFVEINVNGQEILGSSFEIGHNRASRQLSIGNVTCAITAGIGIPQAGSFRDRSSGWFVFCNGRTVISADKSALTGWSNAGLPIFQPKHRPFLGTVFFVSKDAEQLPWTTTKSGINEDSQIWQEAKRTMVSVGREIISFLDGRYGDEGTDIPSEDLQEASGGGARVNVIAAAASTQQLTFNVPKRKPPEKIRIQYDVNVSELKKIEGYLKRPGAGGSEVGRHTFYHFLRNEVGED